MNRRRGVRGGCFIALAAVALLAAGPMAPAAMAGPAAPTAAAPATPAASGAPARPPASSLTADQIVTQYIEARGGLKKIRSIQTLRQKGHATTGAGREGLVTRELKRPDRSRFEFTVQGVTGVFASDGQKGWKVSPFDGEMAPKSLPDEVVQEAAEQADIEGPLVDWKAKGHQVELVGRENVRGREAYKLKVTLKSGAILYDYLDVNSMYLLRTDSTRQVRGLPIQIETMFDDYGKTSGILFPHLVEVVAVGRPQRLRVVVDSIEVNPPLSDARFEMPASAQP